MSQGYCPKCRRIYENAKICGSCGIPIVINRSDIDDTEKRSKHTIISLIFLSIYDILGLIISLNIAEKITKGYQKFLVKLDISYFWLWLFFAVNIILLVGAALFRRNKSLLCVAGKGALWLLTLILSAGINELNTADMEIAWKNGIVSRFGATTEVSRSLGLASFSFGHLFVIALWIGAVILMTMDICRKNA